MSLVAWVKLVYKYTKNIMQLLKKLNWLYAMNGKTVLQNKLENINEVIFSVPASRGLMPFEIILIYNQELKDKFNLLHETNLLLRSARIRRLGNLYSR
jgi:hypothetical protein